MQGAWEAYYNLTGHSQAYRTGEGAADFLLSPIDPDVPMPGTGVDATTWGRIKSLMRPGFVR